MTGNGCINRVLARLGFIDGTCTKDAPNRRGVHSPSLGSRSQRTADMEESPLGDELSVRMWAMIATLVAQCLFGITSVIIALTLDKLVVCTTETEGNFIFGNACQDRLFGVQFLLTVVGVLLIITSLRGMWRQAK